MLAGRRPGLGKSCIGSGAAEGGVPWLQHIPGESGAAVSTVPSIVEQPPVAEDPTARTSAYRHWPVMACYLLGALIVTGRLWVDPAGRMQVGDAQDVNLFAWFLRYSATAISHGQLPALFTTALNAPRGVNLMWNTAFLLPGMLLTPVTLLGGQRDWRRARRCGLRLLAGHARLRPRPLSAGVRRAPAADHRRGAADRHRPRKTGGNRRLAWPADRRPAADRGGDADLHGPGVRSSRGGGRAQPSARHGGPGT